MPAELMDEVGEGNGRALRPIAWLHKKMRRWLPGRKPGMLAHLNCWSNGTREGFFQ